MPTSRMTSSGAEAVGCDAALSFVSLTLLPAAGAAARPCSAAVFAAKLSCGGSDHSFSAFSRPIVRRNPAALGFGTDAAVTLIGSAPRVCAALSSYRPPALPRENDEVLSRREEGSAQYSK